MRKLILKCGLSPGDILMLTAAVRDLHRCYPRRFLTDVRTRCPELWENNPYITKISEDDPLVEQLECSYPLINRCNEAPYHCLHGFIEFFNQRLNLAIKPTVFKGDIHLSAQEKAWYSQVHEVARRDIPFWIVAAGGKYDITIKWWQLERYQEVIDHFRGRLQFVQVGQAGHHHPRLDGVIDLRGQTNLRELLRLVYHSQGVLCPVTSLMHLAAAVEPKYARPATRPCVVIAGGREPAHWEAYPGHQFIHTTGVLACCQNGGCWRDRVVPLRDGDKRDHPDSLCVDARAGLPRCMELITPAEVIRRIELFFTGGLVRPLSPVEQRAATRAMAATRRNGFDREPLSLHEAGLACDAIVRLLPPYTGGHTGRGIVICAGGARYLTSAWVCIKMLRRLGCRLPIQLWHLGPEEVDSRMAALLEPLGVQCVDALKIKRRIPVRILKGWELKPYAILHSSFREVLLLDADNVPVVDPEFLFDTPQFRSTGAVFWPDLERVNGKKQKTIWRSCGLRPPREQEFETGQILVDKARCWQALNLTMWFNENSDFYYQYLHGDKETFHLAFRKMRCRYHLIPSPITRLRATMCQHDFTGRRIFQHRNLDKWDLLLHNLKIKDFWFEEECYAYVRQLQTVWDGGAGKRRWPKDSRKASRPARLTEWPRLAAVMTSCPERSELRAITLNNLAKTDWGATPLHIELDSDRGPQHQQRQTHCAYKALKAALDLGADYVLFLEDDLDFNTHLRHNLQLWTPLRTGAITLASLYNPRIRELGYDVANQARIVAPDSIFGSQAFVLSRATTAYVVRNWHKVPGLQDIRISRLAARLERPLLYHSPSLVQHIGRQSAWGGRFHEAMDFDRHWRRPSG